MVASEKCKVTLKAQKGVSQNVCVQVHASFGCGKVFPCKRCFCVYSYKQIYELSGWNLRGQIEQQCGQCVVMPLHYYKKPKLNLNCSD